MTCFIIALMFRIIYNSQQQQHLIESTKYIKGDKGALLCCFYQFYFSSTPTKDEQARCWSRIESPLYHLLPLYPQSEVEAEKWCMHRLKIHKNQCLRSRFTHPTAHLDTLMSNSALLFSGYFDSDSELRVFSQGSLSDSLDILT